IRGLRRGYCCRHLGAHLSRRWQEALLVFFQNEASQPAGCKRGSINADAVGTNLRSDRRRVTVHNKFAVLRLTGQKRLTNIQKIIAILSIESDPRPHAGMAEEVVADGR